MRKSLVVAGFFVLLLAGAAVAAPAPGPAPVTIGEVNASTNALANQNGVVKSLSDQQDARAKEKAALEKQATGLKEQMARTPAGPKRDVLVKQLTATNEQIDSIFAVMMAFQKELQREAREDQRLAQQTTELSLRTRAAALAAADKKIANAMQEAADRAEATVAASQTHLANPFVLEALRAVVVPVVVPADAGAGKGS